MTEDKAIKEKRSFTVYMKKGDDFVPTGAVMHSAGPTSAAKKAGNDILRATGAKEVEVYLREAGVHNRVRKYICTRVPYLAIEPTGAMREAKKGYRKEQDFKGDEEAFVKRNKFYATNPNNPKTDKPWTDAELADRNAVWIKDGEKIVGMKMLPGKHVVMAGLTGAAEYIEVIKLPEGTLMSARVPEAKEAAVPAEGAAPAAPAEKKKAGRKKAEVAPVVEAAPVA